MLELISNSNVWSFVSCIVQLVGTFMMANALLKVTEGKFRLILQAFFSPRTAKAHADLSDGLSKEDKFQSLRGIALIAIGFAIDLLISAAALVRNLI